MHAHSIHEGRLQTQYFHWGEGLLWLYLGPVTPQRGQVIARLVDAPECENLRALERAAGREFPRVCVLLNTFVADDLLHQGYGIRLYADLARAAAQGHDAPVVSSACRGDDISYEARRLWRSRRLADRVLVRGFTAWGGEV